MGGGSGQTLDVGDVQVVADRPDMEGLASKRLTQNSKVLGTCNLASQQVEGCSGRYVDSHTPTGNAGLGVMP